MPSSLWSKRIGVQQAMVLVTDNPPKLEPEGLMRESQITERIEFCKKLKTRIQNVIAASTDSSEKKFISDMMTRVTNYLKTLRQTTPILRKCWHLSRAPVMGYVMSLKRKIPPPDYLPV
jgi:hypothetical protein